MPTNSEVLRKVLLNHFPEWKDFVHASSNREESESGFEVLSLPVREDLGGHTLSIYDLGDTFLLAYNDTKARRPAEQQIVFGDSGSEEGAKAVVEWLRGLIDERIVVVRFRYRWLWHSPYTLIFFRQRGQRIKKPVAVISWRGTYDYAADAV